MGKNKKGIILTVFNEENSIEGLLDSIVSQTEAPSEVIIVDGGSVDKTVFVMSNYKSSKKLPFELRIYKKRGNRSIGRNEAIRQSKSKIIAITDAGCTLDKNWFKNITKPFSDKSVDVVAGYYKAKVKSLFQKCLVPYVFVMPDKVDPASFLPATRSMAIKRSVWEKSGGFSEKLSDNEDYAFAKKLKSSGFNIVFAKNAFVYWIPRVNFIQAYIMFWRFAKGDAQAKIFRPKVLFIFLRYILFIYLLASNNNLFIVLLALYIIWSITKNYRYVKSIGAIWCLPVMQVVSDVAVMHGTLIGLFRK